MTKKIGIKLLSTAAIILATAAASQATLIGNTESPQSRTTVIADQPRALVGSGSDGLALPNLKFDFEDLSVAPRSEILDCEFPDQCIGNAILKLKDLDARKRPNAAMLTPMFAGVTTTLEKYVADFTWSASTAQKRTYVVIPLEGTQPDERVRDGEVTFSSAATLALIGSALLGLGLAGRRSKHRARSTKSHSRSRPG